MICRTFIWLGDFPSPKMLWMQWLIYQIGQITLCSLIRQKLLSWCFVSLALKQVARPPILFHRPRGPAPIERGPNEVSHQSQGLAYYRVAAPLKPGCFFSPGRPAFKVMVKNSLTRLSPQHPMTIQNPTVST